MRRSILALCAISILAFVPRASLAQSAPFPTSKWFQEVVKHPLVPAQLAGPEHLRDFVVDGKLRLSLDQAIQLALANNTSIRIDELTYQNSWYNVLAAHSPFDPILTGNASASRGLTPQPSQLGGASVLNSLGQTVGLNLSQFLATGTTVTVGTSTTRSSSNSSFNTFNPSYNSGLNFGFTQSLLRGRGLFINRAPIVIAQRGLQQSRDNFESQVSSIIQQVVTDYWLVVLAQESLVVDRKAVDQAQVSYDHDKRSLELGALPPFDIYKSESELATRKVAVIQQEYALKEAEDTLRDAIGADLDSNIGALDVTLVEQAEPTGELYSLDIGQAIQRARAKRPELEAQRLQLDVDDISIKVAHNQMQPSLTLSGNYQAGGLGGNQFIFNNNVNPPVLTGVIPGGLGDALGQISGFQFPTYSASLTLNLPIRNRAAEASLGSNEVNKKRDLFNQRATFQSIELEARNAIHSLEQAKLSIGAAKIARDLTQKNLDAEQRKYDLGVDTIFFLLDAQAQLATADLTLVNAEVSYQLALTAVQHATGELLERYHVQIKDPKPSPVP
jgi:HAE1 family hydrophobic/amphiphilic exporter-1